MVFKLKRTPPPKDYSPEIFSDIRKSIGISTSDYVKSWTYPPDKVPQPDAGAGRSGSLFMRSVDKRFIFKTLPSHEVATLRAILPGYHAHIRDHPDSRLMRFLALHRFVVKGKYLYLVVATNILYSPLGLRIHHKFDLKGRVPKKAPEKRPSEPNGGVWKDNQLTRVFKMGARDTRKTLASLRYRPLYRLWCFSTVNCHEPTLKTSLCLCSRGHFLRSDVDFLMANDCIDYSLLVGVHDVDGKRDQSQKLAMLDTGLNVPAPVFEADGEELFFVGIIDFLSRYQTMKKQTAHFFKSFLWKDETLSTVPSDYYAMRFQDYVPTIVVKGTDREADDKQPSAL